MKTKLTINLNDWSKATKFTKVATDFESDIDIIRGRYLINGKSTMGIFTIDLSKPVEVALISDNQVEINRFIKEMEQFK